MSQEERSRMVILSRVRKKELSLQEGAEVLGISYRQVRRIFKRFALDGDAGLVHRGRGKPSGRQLDPGLRLAVLDAYRRTYVGFGATLASEKLAEREHLTIDRGTLRRWLLEACLLERTRKSSPYRKQRLRRAHFGELVQMDGSDHNWFGDRGGRACLMNMVDDATGTTLSFMSHEETTWAAMTLLSMWIAMYGVPKALYVDAKNVYVTKRPRTVTEELANVDPVTQFGRACQKLGIGLVTAHSPQAKGRVERNHAIYQDRFVKELQLQEINDVAGANEVLPGYCKAINAKFSKKPREVADYHRPWPAGLKREDLFCLEELRVVGKDWVVRYDNHYYQVLKQPKLPPAQSQVIVRETQDGNVRIVYDGHALAIHQITQAVASAQRSLAGSAATTEVLITPAKKAVGNPFHCTRGDAKEARQRKNQWDAGHEVVASLIEAVDPRPGCFNASIIA